jgi:hypothetical protein
VHRWRHLRPRMLPAHSVLQIAGHDPGHGLASSSSNRVLLEGPDGPWAAGEPSDSPKDRAVLDLALIQDSRRSTPRCQEVAVWARDFGLLEEVGVEVGAGVEDLDADEAATLPVDRDEGFDAGQRGAGDVVTR